MIFKFRFFPTLPFSCPESESDMTNGRIGVGHLQRKRSATSKPPESVAEHQQSHAALLNFDSLSHSVSEPRVTLNESTWPSFWETTKSLKTRKRTPAVQALQLNNLKAHKCRSSLLCWQTGTICYFEQLPQHVFALKLPATWTAGQRHNHSWPSYPRLRASHRMWIFDACFRTVMKHFQKLDTSSKFNLGLTAIWMTTKPAHVWLLHG